MVQIEVNEDMSIVYPTTKTYLKGTGKTPQKALKNLSKNYTPTDDLGVMESVFRIAHAFDTGDVIKQIDIDNNIFEMVYKNIPYTGDMHDYTASTEQPYSVFTVTDNEFIHLFIDGVYVSRYPLSTKLQLRTKSKHLTIVYTTTDEGNVSDGYIDGRLIYSKINVAYEKDNLIVLETNESRYVYSLSGTLLHKLLHTETSAPYTSISYHNGLLLYLIQDRLYHCGTLVCTDVINFKHIGGEWYMLNDVSVQIKELTKW